MTLTSLLLVTLAVIAVLTAVATAVRSVSRIWLRHWVEQQLSGAPAAELYLERPQRLILAATTAVAMTVFVAGILVGTAGLSLVTGLETLFAYAVALLVLGQLIPRAIARRWPHVIIPPFLPFLRLAEFILTPLLYVVRRLTGEVVLERRDARAAETDSLEELLREGELEGVGEHTEIAIIEGVVQFGARQVRDVMTPRGDIFAIEADTPPPELAARLAASGYSRVPVYRGSLDHIVGMVHAFDVLQAAEDGTPRLRPVGVALPASSCKDLLFRMLKDRRHLAVVRAETGEVAGIVTLEDLLEELVGDIRDEHDEPARDDGGRR